MMENPLEPFYFFFERSRGYGHTTDAISRLKPGDLFVVSRKEQRQDMVRRITELRPDLPKGSVKLMTLQDFADPRHMWGLPPETKLILDNAVFYDLYRGVEDYKRTSIHMLLDIVSKNIEAGKATLQNFYQIIWDYIDDKFDDRGNRKPPEGSHYEGDFHSHRKNK